MLNEIFNELEYDPETGRFSWKTMKPGRRVDRIGTHRHDGYHLITVNYKRYLAHQLAWLFVYGEWADCNIDHIDGNPSNNKISNLRKCDQLQNIANSKLRTNNTSGYKGVYWSKKNRNWVARVKVNYIYKHIGCFNDPAEAHAAYVAAAEKFHGEFARAE